MRIKSKIANYIMKMKNVSNVILIILSI